MVSDATHAESHRGEAASILRTLEPGSVMFMLAAVGRCMHRQGGFREWRYRKPELTQVSLCKRQRDCQLAHSLDTSRPTQPTYWEGENAL